MQHALWLTAAALALGLAAGAARAQNVEVKDAWVRTTVPGQSGTGAFMKITAKEGLRLVGVSTPAAGVAQVHEMKMDGDVMRMRALSGLDLPAGKTVELKPGGFHLMLMELSAALPKDSTIALTLMFKDAKGAQSELKLQVPVSVRAPGSSASASAGTPEKDPHAGHHKH